MVCSGPEVDSLSAPATSSKSAPSLKKEVADESSQASSSSAALQKAEQPPLQKQMPLVKVFGFVLPPRPRVRVGVDWHNTVEVGGEVPPANLRALQLLVDAGVAVFMLSFIGRNSKERRDEYYRLALSLPMVADFDRVCDCSEKTGRGGKVELYKSWGVTTLFDDNRQICEEGFRNRIQVFPITTPHEKHQWFFDEGFRPYRTFAVAVGDFLDSIRGR